MTLITTVISMMNVEIIEASPYFPVFMLSNNVNTAIYRDREYDLQAALHYDEGGHCVSGADQPEHRRCGEGSDFFLSKALTYIF